MPLRVHDDPLRHCLRFMDVSLRKACIIYLKTAIEGRFIGSCPDLSWACCQATNLLARRTVRRIRIRKR